MTTDGTETSALVRQAREQQRDRWGSAAATLRGELTQARAIATQAHALRLEADAAWDARDAAHAAHTVAEAERVEQRRAADDAARAKVRDLETRLQEAEGELRALQQNDAREQAMRRAAELWPPASRALVEPVRALMAAIQAQRAAWETLVSEQANGMVEQDTLLSANDFSDNDLLTRLERWLAAMERAGYATPASPEKRGLFHKTEKAEKKG